MGLTAEDCETIVKRDGEEIEAKIVEVGIDEIRYKKCGMENGPVFVLKKSDVFMIRYANGEKDIITKFDKETATPEETRRVARYYEEDGSTDASGAWVGGFLLGLFLGLIGLLIALLAFKGYHRKKAINGALVGILAIVLITILISLAVNA